MRGLWPLVRGIRSAGGAFRWRFPMRCHRVAPEHRDGMIGIDEQVERVQVAVAGDLWSGWGWFSVSHCAAPARSARPRAAVNSKVFDRRCQGGGNRGVVAETATEGFVGVLAQVLEERAMVNSFERDLAAADPVREMCPGVEMEWLVDEHAERTH